MKGMMVALLVWVMTGTVVGQQSYQANGNQLGRFILYLNDQDLLTLKANPEGLSAPVSGAAQGKLTEVRLRYGRQPTSTEMQSLDVEPGQFNLWLDDATIADLKDSPDGLEADVPASLQDKIMKVLIKYGTSPNAQANRSNSFGNDAGSFGSNRAGSVVDNRSARDLSMSLEEQISRSRNESGNSAINFDKSNSNSGMQYPTYGPQYIPEESPTSRSAIGPSIAQNPRYQDPNTAEFRPRFNSGGQSIVERDLPMNNNFGANDNSWSRQMSNNPATADIGQPKTTLSPIVDNSDLEVQRELIRRETQRLAAERTAQEAAERRALEKRLAEEKAQFQHEQYLAQLRQESRNSRVNATMPTSTVPEPRYASNTQEFVAPTAYPFPNRRTDADTTLDDYDTNSVPPRQKFTTPPRVAQKGGVSDYQMSISGPANDVTSSVNKNSATNTALAEQAAHSTKANNFIFFMLLMSLGLNFYLAWISRGFYVRYNELADELRETFTSSG